jgi:CzcA family heavy metal efflux pump
MLEILLKKPIAVIIGALLIGLAGISGLHNLPVDLFPNLNYPLINIITHYPAGTAEDMEQLVTRPIENSMQGLNNLQRVSSTSAPGFSQVTVEFTWGVDVLQARQLVYGRLAQVRSGLPAGAESELENIGTSLAMLSTYTLSGGNPVQTRSWVQYQLIPRLTSLTGVSRVEVMGGGMYAWRVDLDPLKLRQAGLSSKDIAEAIRRANILDTGGYIEQHGRDLLIRTDGRLLSINDLRSVPVQHADSASPLRLSDIAEVYLGTRPQRYVITENRLPAVAFTIQKQPGASTLDVSRLVDKELAGTTLPTGVKLEKFYDQAEIIGLAYRNMRNHLLSGAGLAILAVLFILGRNRATLSIALTFPLTVLGTFWVMHAMGLGLNLMTLGALTVAIGMVADDSIVVLENIDRHRNMGQTPWQAALNGTREILGADIAGTMTVLAAFAPLVLIGGLAGRLFHPFGLSFSVLLLFSLLLSVTLIPLTAAYWMRPLEQVKKQVGTGARWIQSIEHINLRLLDHFLRHRAITILTSSLLLLCGIGLLVFNPARLLPLLDENSLLVSYQLPPGTSLAESNRIGDQLEEKILSLPAVHAVFRRTGSPESSFYIEGPDQGELVVRIDRSGKYDTTTLKQKLDHLIQGMDGVIGRVNEPTSEKLDESFSGLPALFGITLYGTNLDELYKAASLVESTAHKLPGLANVVNNTKIPVDQLAIRLNPEKLALRGVSAEDAALTIRMAMQGATVTEVVKEQMPVPVFLRFQPQYRDQIEDVEQIAIPMLNGSTIPLSQVADIKQSSSHPTITHQHGLRSLTLTAEIDGNPLTILRDLDTALAALHLPAGIQIAYTGEYGQLIKTASQMFWVLLGSALLVYGIIALQLDNLLDPLVVLVKLPLDFMGAALALYLTRQSIDLTVFIGFITLIGVSTNNGIMLLTFARKFRKQGMEAMEAIREAARVRTRPMILTHLTTLLALIPASLGLGDGPQLLQPLGIMLFGGLTTGTLFTLNLLPTIYMATERWRKKTPHDRLKA